MIYTKKQCIKDKDFNTLTAAKDVLGRWHAYGKNLLNFENEEEKLI